MMTPKSHPREVHDDPMLVRRMPVLQDRNAIRAEVRAVLARILARDLLALGSHTV
jgi:hypothetical protein